MNQANPGCPTFTGSGAPGNYFGYPASALDAGANFGGSGNTDDDIAGSFQAQQTAGILNGVCAGLASTTPCSFVLNTGDNFYQCGVDDYFNPSGFPLASGSTANNTRLYTDWYSFYQTSATPAIQNLPWYSTIGNHDLPTPGGVDVEIAYDRQGNYAGQPYYPIGQNWNLPARYYSVDYVSSASAASVRVINLDTNPCNADYVNKVGKAMYALSNEGLSTITYDYIASQMSWFNATLVAAVTTGCGGSGCGNVVVMSHYSLYGTDQGFGNLNSNSPTYRKPPSSSAGNWTAGSLGVFNCFGQIQNIMNQQNGLYAPDVWVNGHDHTNAISFSSDYNTTAGADTIFVTSGTGSLWQGGDGYPALKGGNLTGAFPSIPGSKGVYPYNVAFSSPSPDGSVANGGVSLITITATALTVDTYVTQNGPKIPVAGARSPSARPPGTHARDEQRVAGPRGPPAAQPPKPAAAAERRAPQGPEAKSHPPPWGHPSGVRHPGGCGRVLGAGQPPCGQGSAAAPPRPAKGAVAGWGCAAHAPRRPPLRHGRPGRVPARPGRVGALHAARGVGVRAVGAAPGGGAADDAQAVGGGSQHARAAGEHQQGACRGPAPPGHVRRVPAGHCGGDKLLPGACAARAGVPSHVLLTPARRPGGERPGAGGL